MRLESWAPRVLILNPMRLRWGAPNVAAAAHLDRLMAAETWRIAVTPSDLRPQEFDAVAEHATKRAYELGDVLVCADEIDQLSERVPALESIVRWGRNRRISVCATARRPAEVQRNITANLTHLTIFNISEPRDLEYLRHFSLGESVSEAPLLGKFQYITWDLYSHRFHRGRT